MKPNAYLDAVKAQLNIESDYALAKRMGVTRGQIVHFRNESRPIPMAMVFKIAITLEIDPAYVVADLEEQRAKNPEKREFWRGFLQRASHLTIAILCTLALSFSAIYGTGAERFGGSFFRRAKRA